jgi:hypothetical protein
VYQVDPNLSVANVMSLAWFAQHSWPTTKQLLTWDITYTFVWGETGLLIPGVVFNDSQSWPADPASPGASIPIKAGSQISFAFRNRAYTFRSVAGTEAQHGRHPEL